MTALCAECEYFEMHCVSKYALIRCKRSTGANACVSCVLTKLQSTTSKQCRWGVWANNATQSNLICERKWKKSCSAFHRDFCSGASPYACQLRNFFAQVFDAPRCVHVRIKVFLQQPLSLFSSWLRLLICVDDLYIQKLFWRLNVTVFPSVGVIFLKTDVGCK